MNYKIADTRDIHNYMRVDFGKNGNKYTVSPYNEGNTEYTVTEFDTLDKAYTAYEKIVKAIATGCYNYEQRKAMLA